VELLIKLPIIHHYIKTRSRQSNNPESVEGEFLVVVNNELLPDVVDRVLQEVREHNLPPPATPSGQYRPSINCYFVVVFFLGFLWGEGDCK